MLENSKVRCVLYVLWLVAPRKREWCTDIAMYLSKKEQPCRRQERTFIKGKRASKHFLRDIVVKRTKLKIMQGVCIHVCKCYYHVWTSHILPHHFHSFLLMIPCIFKEPFVVIIINNYFLAIFCRHSFTTIFDMNN